MSRWLPIMLLMACTPAPRTVRVMTLNAANGAGDRFRTSDTRSLQRSLLQGADIAALQEVDVGVERSGKLNTPLEVAGPAFSGCTFAVTAAPHLSPDGVLRCSADAGTVLFGLGFRGNDGVSGIIDADTSLNPASEDRSPDALYGNALVIRGLKLDSAVVVALPVVTDMSLEPYATLSKGPLEALAAHNLATRTMPDNEPRSVLVARLGKIVVLATHLETAAFPAVRAAQLNAALAIARAERAQGRRVIFMGDFNMPSSEAEAVLADAGFAHSVGDGIDQVWADPSLSVSEVSERPTEGASDHPVAPSVTLSEP